jgi:hypothetical protein
MSFKAADCNILQVVALIKDVFKHNIAPNGRTNSKLQKHTGADEVSENEISVVKKKKKLRRQ